MKVRDNPWLSRSQRDFLLGLPREVWELYSFSGGTALSAFYLQHRVSEDVDLKSLELDFVPPAGLLGKWLRGLEVISRSRIHERRLFLLRLGGEEVKVEFFPAYFPRLQDPLVVEGIKVDSFEDLVADKVIALADRFDPRDLVDLFFIWKLKGMTLREMVELARKKHDAPYHYQLRLVRGLGIEEEPLRLRKPFSREEFREFINRSQEEFALMAEQDLSDNLHGPGSPEP